MYWGGVVETVTVKLMYTFIFSNLMKIIVAASAEKTMLVSAGTAAEGTAVAGETGLMDIFSIG